MELLFARHAQTVTNAGLISAQDLLMGKENKLSSKGVVQALALSEKLKKITQLEKIYHSGLLRAKQTAEIIYENTPNTQLVLDNNFKEIDPGIMPADEFDLRLEKCRLAMMGKLEKLYPGGETMGMAKKRAMISIERLSKLNASDKSLIITHKELMLAVFHNYLQQSGERIRITNCDVFSVVFNDTTLEAEHITKL
jgi:broad specificity phosphatase PhoE